MFFLKEFRENFLAWMMILIAFIGVTMFGIGLEIAKINPVGYIIAYDSFIFVPIFLCYAVLYIIKTGGKESEFIIEYFKTFVKSKSSLVTLALCIIVIAYMEWGYLSHNFQSELLASFCFWTGLLPIPIICYTLLNICVKTQINLNRKNI